MKLFLREYSNVRLLAEQRIDLRGKEVVTIGRSSECDYRVGSSFPETARSISAVQATIRNENGVLTLIDGAENRRSRNGIFFNGENVAQLQLEVGQVIYLFQLGQHRVELAVVEPTVNDNSTYSEGEYLASLQNAIDFMRAELDEMRSKLTQHVKEFISHKIEIADRLREIGDQQSQALSEINRQLRERKRIDDQQFKMIKTIAMIGGFAILVFAIMSATDPSTKKDLNEVLATVAKAAAGAAVLYVASAGKSGKEKGED